MIVAVEFIRTMNQGSPHLMHELTVSTLTRNSFKSSPNIKRRVYHAILFVKNKKKRTTEICAIIVAELKERGVKETKRDIAPLILN